MDIPDPCSLMVNCGNDVIRPKYLCVYIHKSVQWNGKILWMIDGYLNPTLSAGKINCKTYNHTDNLSIDCNIDRRLLEDPAFKLIQTASTTKSGPHYQNTPENPWSLGRLSITRRASGYQDNLWLLGKSSIIRKVPVVRIGLDCQGPSIIKRISNIYRNFRLLKESPFARIDSEYREGLWLSEYLLIMGKAFDWQMKLWQLIEPRIIRMVSGY